MGHAALRLDLERENDALRAERDRLRAENGHLTRERDEFGATMRALHAEVQRLKDYEWMYKELCK